MGVGKDLWTEFQMQYNKQGVSQVASFWASDAVYTDPTGRYEGREAIQGYLQQADKPFSDLRMDTTLLIEEGDTVVAEYELTATITGPISMPDGTEIPATGKTLEMYGVSVITVRDGKFAIQHDYYDMAAFMSQLGLMPGT
jgi:steroid delta-isomerase-like uncharacterized protein